MHCGWSKRFVLPARLKTMNYIAVLWYLILLQL